MRSSLLSSPVALDEVDLAIIFPKALSNGDHSIQPIGHDNLSLNRLVIVELIIWPVRDGYDYLRLIVLLKLSELHLREFIRRNVPNVVADA